MGFGPHTLDLPIKGRIELENGMLVCYRNDERNNPQPFGRIYIGPDGLTVDGMEPTFVQLGDPGKIRIGSRGGGGRNKGFISFNHIRDDGRGEELAYLGGGLADDAPEDGSDLRGQIVINIRPHHDGETETAFVATTAFLGRVWTGLRNNMGWLWKFSYAGDDLPTDGRGAAPAFLRAPGGQTELHSQGDGNAVMYDVRPFVTIDGVRGFVPLATLKDGKIRDFRDDGQYTA